MQSIVVHTGRSRNGHIGAIHTCMQGLYYCYGRNCYNYYRAPRAPWQWGGRSGRGPHYTILVYGRARHWARPYYYAISTRIWNQDERRGARGDPHGLVVPGGHTGALGASRRPGGSNTPAPGLSIQMVQRRYMQSGIYSTKIGVEDNGGGLDENSRRDWSR